MGRGRSDTLFENSKMIFPRNFSRGKAWPHENATNSPAVFLSVSLSEVAAIFVLPSSLVAS